MLEKHATNNSMIDSFLLVIRLVLMSYL